MVNTPVDSDVIEYLKSWLGSLDETMRTKSADATRLAIRKAASHLGYDEPFDREQKRLNTLLVSHGANELGCLSVWSAYHDYKMAQGNKRASKRTAQ